MPDIIKLLPDSIANQIAAGEVVQHARFCAISRLFTPQIRLEARARQTA